MNKLFKARKNLAQNSKKGFTLVELIIVIVIIAILIAALLPAVMGAIDRANIQADRSDARNVLTASAVVAIAPDGSIDTTLINNFNVGGAINGGLAALQSGMTFTIFIDGTGMPVGVTWTGGRSATSGVDGVGTVTGAGVTALATNITT